jgi:hypothetical protein
MMLPTRLIAVLMTAGLIGCTLPHQASALSCSSGFRIVWQPELEGLAFDETKTRQAAQSLLGHDGPIWLGSLNKAVPTEPRTVWRRIWSSTRTPAPRYYVAPVSVDVALRGNVSSQSTALIIKMPEWPGYQQSDAEADARVDAFVKSTWFQRDPSPLQGRGIMFADMVDAFLDRLRDVPVKGFDSADIEPHRGKVLVVLRDCSYGLFWPYGRLESQFLLRELRAMALKTQTPKLDNDTKIEGK